MLAKIVCTLKIKLVSHWRRLCELVWPDGKMLRSGWMLIWVCFQLSIVFKSCGLWTVLWLSPSQIMKHCSHRFTSECRIVAGGCRTVMGSVLWLSPSQIMKHYNGSHRFTSECRIVAGGCRTVAGGVAFGIVPSPSPLGISVPASTSQGGQLGIEQV